MSEVMRAARACKKPLTLREQVDMSRDCLSGLHYLHERVSVIQLFDFSIQSDLLSVAISALSSIPRRYPSDECVDHLSHEGQAG